MRSLAGFKLKGSNKSPLACFLIAFIYSLTAYVFQSWEFLTSLLSCSAAVLKQKSKSRNQPVLGSGLCTLDFSTLKAILIQAIVI